MIEVVVPARFRRACALALSTMLVLAPATQAQSQTAAPGDAVRVVPSAVADALSNMPLQAGSNAVGDRELWGGSGQMPGKITALKHKIAAEAASTPWPEVMQRYLFKNANELALLSRDDAFLHAWMASRYLPLERLGEANCAGALPPATDAEAAEHTRLTGVVYAALGDAKSAPAPASAAELDESIRAVRSRLSAAETAILDAARSSDDISLTCKSDLIWYRAVLNAPTTHRARLVRDLLYQEATMPAAIFGRMEIVAAQRRVSQWSAKPDPDYPPLAAALGIEATVTVRVSVDADGKLASARVQSRRLRVPGIGDRQPLVFERWFDEASLRKIRSVIESQGKRPRIEDVEVIWRLPASS